MITTLSHLKKAFFLAGGALFLATGAFSRVGAATAPNVALYQSGTASALGSLRLEWFDQSRQRAVPVQIYYPQNGKGPFPLLIVSHGLGGTRDSLQYVGKYWASNGYISAQIQHVGSDDSAWRGKPQPMTALKQAASNITNILNRPRDVSFAIDQVLKMNADTTSPLYGKVDSQKIGVAGHSFGGYTALASSGRVGAGIAGKPLDLHDPRISACVAMSAPTQPLNQIGGQYANFKIPVYHLTGTLDDSPIGDTKAVDRRAPFDAITGIEEYLLTLQGANHMTLGGGGGGLRMKPGQPNDAIDQQIICASTTAFWDAYLKGSPTAKAYLRSGNFSKDIGAYGKFEMK